MTIKVRIVFHDPNIRDTPADWGKRVSSVVEGNEVPYDKITLGDLTDKITETEAHLSRITGLVVRIETGAE
jgi:hypothetical protein